MAEPETLPGAPPAPPPVTGTIYHVYRRETMTLALDGASLHAAAAEVHAASDDQEERAAVKELLAAVEKAQLLEVLVPLGVAPRAPNGRKAVELLAQERGFSEAECVGAFHAFPDSSAEPHIRDVKTSLVWR